MHVLCRLGLHGLVEKREYEKLANLPEDWIGNAGILVIKEYGCRRKNCSAAKEIITDCWTEKKFCKNCDKETRQEHRVFSDIGGWDVWYGQGDRRDFFRCLECGTIGKLLYGTGDSCKIVEIDWPQIPASILAANSLV